LETLANFYEAEKKEYDPPLLLKIIKVGVPLGAKISDFVNSTLDLTRKPN
uniref:Uncharacterized protein n=1 Tax=Ditylenchus dipsaci TaxID=166011 RepID=A0A915DFC6_9BILA